MILSTVNYTNKNSKDFEIFKRNYELQKQKGNNTHILNRFSKHLYKYLVFKGHSYPCHLSIILESSVERTLK